MLGHYDKSTPDLAARLINAIPDNAECVREITGKRETWKVSDSNVNYYVKIVFHNTLLRKLISVLKLSKPFKESGVFQILNDKDILIPELTEYGVHYGMFGFPLKEYIITKEVENSLRLKDFFFGKFQYLNRLAQKQLVSDFAKYIRSLHDKGVVHRDPNLGNFLIQQTDRGENQFYILDLADVKTKKALSLSERWNNFALINLNFFKTVPTSLRYYFFKSYAQGIFDDKAGLLQAIKIIENRTLNLGKKTLAKRVKWCLGNNSFFCSIEKGSFKIHFKRDWRDNKEFQKLLDSPDQYLDKGEGVILKDGRTVKAASVDIRNDKRLFLKRFNRKNFFHTFKNVFRPSRAKRVWMNSYGFELRGIPIPKPVAYMEDRRFRILRRSYVVSEFIQDAHTMSSLFKDSAIPSEDRLSIMKLVGSEMGRMHMLGCLHGDLKWSNILIKRTDGKYECFFTDLDGSKIKRKLTFSDITDELARFYEEMLNYKLCMAEEEAFFRAYHRNCRREISYDSMVRKARKGT